MNNLINSIGLFLQVDADQRFLFADEKINTVIVVVMAVFVGIVIYMFLTGKKVRKIEKELEVLRNRKQSQSKKGNQGTSIEIERRK